MKTKKIPMRSCVVSKEKLPKSELIRIVKFNDQIFVDTTGKQNGKGCYLKKDKEILEKARKNHVLEKVLDSKIDDIIYEEIEKQIN